MDDTRARFLTEIVNRLGADRVVELHLFSPIRQGSMETGVAVVAVTPGAEHVRVVDDAAVQSLIDAAVPLEAADAVSPEATDAVLPEAADAAPSVAPVSLALNGEPRLVIHTARYRLVRKGPDRGKWLVEVAATADAPLATVDAVARGVTQRSKDLTETERFSGDQLRALLEDPLWRTPT
ncbi:MAG TPA: hypothetical protein VGJ96_04670 [Gemmatimonadaceae bacterium]|jgi:hypothetical protein